jgi:transposase
MPQITLMTGAERRRQWSDEERQRILVAAFSPGAIVSKVARQFEVSTSLVYKWRNQMLASPQGSTFAPAVLLSSPEATPEAALPSAELPVITVELANGTRLKINAQASPASITAALQALR